MSQGARTENLTVSESSAGERLDVWLAENLPDFSRSAVQRLIREGHVRVGGEVESKRSAPVKPGVRVEVEIPASVPAVPEPQAIDLDIVYEDSSLLVINKPAGLVVHPARGTPDGTLVNALLHHCDDLSSIGGVDRPGIVHRLDKLTSGLMVVAKNDRAHRSLTEQLARREIKRVYIAVVWGEVPLAKGTIDAPVGRHHRDRKRMAVVPEGRRAVTHYRRIAAAGGLSVLELTLETGRTHQIRVHVAHLGHPVVGDDQYGVPTRRLRGRLAQLAPSLRNAAAAADRQLLHARRLRFIHPESGEATEFEAALPGQVERLVLAVEYLARS